MIVGIVLSVVVLGYVGLGGFLAYDFAKPMWRDRRFFERDAAVGMGWRIYPLIPWTLFLITFAWPFFFWYYERLLDRGGYNED